MLENELTVFQKSVHNDQTTHSGYLPDMTILYHWRCLANECVCVPVFEEDNFTWKCMVLVMCFLVQEK